MNVCLCARTWCESTVVINYDCTQMNVVIALSTAARYGMCVLCGFLFFVSFY